MLKEVFGTHPAIREACRATIFGHVEMLEADIEAAMRQRKIDGDWTAGSLARHMQAVCQGAFVLAKAESGTDAATTMGGIFPSKLMVRSSAIIANNKPAHPGWLSTAVES